MKFQSISLVVLLYVTANSTAFQTSLQPLTNHHVPFQGTSSSLAAASKEFVNDGPFFFMQPFLEVLGFKEGTTTFYGPAKAVDPKDYPSTEEQMKLQKKAAEEMVNINQDERDRRIYAGNIAYLFSGYFRCYPLSQLTKNYSCEGNNTSVGALTRVKSK